jgi:hypothetical protein
VVGNKIGYDAFVTYPFPTLIEAKTGQRDFPNSKGEHDRVAKQFNDQAAVAKYCKFPYIIAVDNPTGADVLAEQFPTMPIEHIPFGGGF